MASFIIKTIQTIIKVRVMYLLYYRMVHILVLQLELCTSMAIRIMESVILHPISKVEFLIYLGDMTVTSVRLDLQLYKI